METKISPATQLSKKQMNAVKGGNNVEAFECVAFLADGEKQTYKVDAVDHYAAADKIHAITGAGQVNCTRY